jgi:ribonucleoside-diphosphate reductase alpha chain
MSSIYKKLSEERKQLQAVGEVPEWYTTGGYQMFMEKYTLPGQTLKERYWQVAETAGNLADELYGDSKADGSSWAEDFFDIIWRGWLSPSTPVLANLGTGRGMPVSCSGGVVGDSVHGFYSSRHETAMLTKYGFGTSAYMGEIRPRGSEISAGGKASGSLPVFLGFVQDMRDVSQGNVRRGSWAGYLEVDHGDFHEVADHLLNNPDDFNIGWIIPNSFIEKLGKGDKESISRYQKIMKIRKITGKGYMYFVDKVNDQSPAMYKDKDMKVKASNLCSEIALFSDEDHTFTCVLSSMNLRFYDDWKDTNAVELAIIFLDCVAEAFLRQAKDIPGFEKAIRFTEKSRALGLGTMGFHTYLQDRMIALESAEAHMINNSIYKGIRMQAEKASEWMASVAGEPDWCKGYGRRNTHLIAIAPNMSTALICGGVSQGIEPVAANVFNQNTSAGEIQRVNPSLLKVMRERGVYNKETINQLIDARGSILGVDWLTDEEKLVFRTAFEVDQMALLRLASARQRYIDQGQSLNLFFAAEEDPKYISQIHRAAAEDPNIKALYYMRSQAGIQAAKDECIACEG